MASSIREIKSNYIGSGAPSASDAFPNLGPGKYYWDYFNQKEYKYISLSSGWQPSNELYPKPETMGAVPTIQVGNVITLPAGSPATVTDRDTGPNVLLDFGIPAGPQGPQGVPGAGSGTGMAGFTWVTSEICETPVMYMVMGLGNGTTVGSNTAQYAQIGATSTDLKDWANIQLALFLANQKKKAVVSAGDFFTHKMVDLGKNSYRISWDGQNNTTIKTQNNNAYKAVGRPDPTDNTDANLMIQATYVIKGVSIQTQSNQSGFEPGPSYSSQYDMIRVSGQSTYGILLRFSLNTKVASCDVSGAQNAMIADYGNWNGATAANSQSNHTIYYNCHVSGGSNGVLAKVGFGAYGSSGVFWKDCIAEWYGFERSFVTDFKNSTVVKTGGAYNQHVEGILGNRGAASGDAYFYVRMPGTYTINNSFMQYAGCMVNAGTSAGQLQLIVEQTPWNVLPADGKLFVNAGNCFFDFRDNGSGEMNNPSAMTNKFYVGPFPGGTGVSTTVNGGYLNGINKWSMRGMGFTAGIYEYTGATARMAETVQEPILPVKLTLVAKDDHLAELKKHPRLSSLVAQMMGVHEWYFETVEQAQEFADANPDFNPTITK